MEKRQEQSYGEILWNSEKKEFLGRTGSSWCKIGFFYLIYYSCLAGFFSICMAGMYQTLDTEHRPTYIPGDGSSILKHPALGYRPLPRDDNIESSLIWYKNGDNDDIKHWTDELDDFIAAYEHGGAAEGAGGHIIRCAEDKLPGPDQVCVFDDKWLKGKCHRDEKWGYSSESPCVILKLNKMIEWTPDVYKNVKELDKDMPKSLVNHIKSQAKSNGDIPKMIWVSCRGENVADEEHIGLISYSPWQGFPAYYFPYRNIPGYLSPIVAVEFDRPDPNILLNIECKAWAKNIKHDRGKRLGLVHFEILRD